MNEKVIPVNFRAGDLVFKEGDIADAVYLISNGIIEIVREREGQKIVLAELGSKQLFGEMALIDGKPRSAHAIAKTDIWCFKISKEEFEKRISGLDPAISAMFRMMVGIIRRQNEELLSRK